MHNYKKNKCWQNWNKFSTLECSQRWRRWCQEGWEEIPTINSTFNQHLSHFFIPSLFKGGTLRNFWHKPYNRIPHFHPEPWNHTFIFVIVFLISHQHHLYLIGIGESRGCQPPLPHLLSDHDRLRLVWSGFYFPFSSCQLLDTFSSYKSDLSDKVFIISTQAASF